MRRRRRPSINITSLIDVMFLLLIFFMVSSTFKQQPGLDIALPQAETASPQDVTTKEIVIDGEGRLFFAAQPVDEDGLRAALIQYLAESPEGLLVLRADAKTDFGRVARALDIARAVGGKQVIVPTDPLEESRER